jgi:RHS repeat-associated protein
MPAPAVVTDYLGGYQYVDATLQFFPHAEGYIKYTEGVSNPYDYVFNYTDHLGNIRLSYGADPANPALLKKYEENNYYPFGLKHKEYNNALRIIVKAEPVEAIASGKKIAIFQTDPLKPITTISNSSYNYKYNGKELQDELGLNMYDYGARNYDPSLGRWNVIDEKAEKFSGVSSYVYSANNPILFTDPDGKDVHITIGNNPVGTTSIRLIGTNGEAPRDVQVALYEMKVTDDVTGKTSTYQVTRDAPVLNSDNPVNEANPILEFMGLDGDTYNVDNTAFEPANGDGNYIGIALELSLIHI